MSGPSPVYLKPGGALRKPLKIKLNNIKPKAKPTFGYDKPFKYETPTSDKDSRGKCEVNTRF